MAVKVNTPTKQSHVHVFSLCNLIGSARILAAEVHGLTLPMLPGSLLPSENESLGTRLAGRSVVCKGRRVDE